MKVNVTNLNKLRKSNDVLHDVAMQGIEAYLGIHNKASVQQNGDGVLETKPSENMINFLKERKLLEA